MKIYVPNYESYNCAVVTNANTIRVYDTVPTHNSTIDYTDYYYTGHYYFVRGTATFSNYSTLPNCLYDDDITTNVYYRNDFADIMIIFSCILVFCWFFISLLIKKLLKGKRYL